MNIREIAKRANVSVATVSRVLNHPESVALTTRKRIENIIKEEEYTPNWFARGLNFNKTGTIGLMIPHVLNAVHMETAKGVEDVAYQKGYTTFMCNMEDDVAKERHYLQHLIMRKVDGIILISSTLEEKDFDVIRNHKIPFVLIGREKKETEISTVNIDCEKGARQAIGHFLQIGYTKIAILIGDSRGIDREQKTKGYRESLEEAGIPLRDEDMRVVRDSVEGGYLGAKQIIQSGRIPQGIFATSDSVALGAIDAVHDLGLSIPQDIGVIGFDNIKYGSLVTPKLTTVEVPHHKMGVYGARLLFDHIEEENGYRQIILQTKMKIRKSCGHNERIGEMF